MASSREEWQWGKAVLKREIKAAWRDVKSNDEPSPKTTPRTEAVNKLDAHVYAPLPGPGYIRLLEILPGADDEVLQVKLSAVSLEESRHQYESLSYVWGNPNQSKETIVVNGAIMQIYESLHTILTSLRARYQAGVGSATAAEKNRVLWVDAICINQSDMAEKNSQVPMMDQVYTNSKRTVVWLRNEGTRTKETFDMLHDLAQEAMMSVKPSSSGWDSEEKLTLPAMLRNFLLNESVQNRKKALYNGDETIWAVISSEWWYRSWTMQEILLPARILLVQGRHEIDWQDFCAAIDFGLKLRIWYVLDVGATAFVNQSILPYFTVRSLRARIAGLRGWGERTQAQNEAETLQTLLENCRMRESRDPRDKIFAVFGIMKRILDTKAQGDPDYKRHLLIDLDYANPVVYVYRMISMELITKSRSLDVLGICPTSTRRGLPSWVTDWSITGSAASPLTRDSLDRPRGTHATRGSTASVQFPVDAVTMVLRGHVLTSVSELAEVLRMPIFRYTGDGSEDPDASTRKIIKDSWNEAHEALHGSAMAFRTIFAWERFAAQQTPQNPCPDAPETLYWKTLCAGTYDAANVAHTEGLYQTWLRTLKNPRNNEKRYGSLSSKLNPLIYSLQSSTWRDGYPEFALYLKCADHRRLGWCGNGWLAMLPEDTRPGDQILLVEGGRVPLVLRADGDGYYAFVGEAYVHGIMNGQAFRPTTCEDIKVC